jgi:hypothetical protein
VDKAELERDIAGLEAQLATLQWTESHGRSTLAALEQQLDELRAQIAEARRIEVERDQRLEHATGEAAAEALGDAIDRVLAAIAAYDEARATAAATRSQLPPAAMPDAPPEPPPAAKHEAVSERWAALLAAVGPRGEQELEDDLVEAAARSAMGHAIPALPAHLRPLARRRREDYLSNLARSGRASEAGS